jgi:hypothetical protein
MNDISRMFQNQAKWQKERACLSWPEKIRMAEDIRQSIISLRTSAAARGDPFACTMSCKDISSGIQTPDDVKK